MNPDRLLEVGIAIAQRLPNSKRSEFADFLKRIESSGSNDSDLDKSDDRGRGRDDSSEGGESWILRKLYFSIFVASRHVAEIFCLDSSLLVNVLAKPTF